MKDTALLTPEDKKIKTEIKKRELSRHKGAKLTRHKKCGGYYRRLYFYGDRNGDASYNTTDFFICDKCSNIIRMLVAIETIKIPNIKLEKNTNG